MGEFKSYDSDSKYINFGARLTNDPAVVENEHGTLVRLKFVETSRNESDAEMWIEATPADRQADIAQFLKKGDTIGVEGHLSMSRFGEGGAKVGFRIRRAELHIPIALFQVLKERGFTPSAKATGAAPKGKAPPPAFKTAAPKREVVDVDLDAE